MIRSRLQARSWKVWRWNIGRSRGCCNCGESTFHLTTLRAIEAAVEPRTRNAFVARSYYHRARGYLAGLHSYVPREEEGTAPTEPPDFESFDSAWDALESVPEELLKNFEDELWESQSRRFVYGTKQVSVIDAVESGHEDDKNVATPTKVFRYLIFNERPNLIQTSVEVASVGSSYHHYSHRARGKLHPEQLIANPPSPISQTHLGGLAMVLPFWYKANEITIDKSNYDAPISTTTTYKNRSIPNCLLIGAGGCSLAHTLAANLFLEEYNQNMKSDQGGNLQSLERPRLTAVEACQEVMKASRLWFGAERNENSEEKHSDIGSTGSVKPPFFDLVHDTGESYLRSLIESRGNTTTNSSSISPQIDILIIDAEDGSAPPKSMQSREFWNTLVLPSLNLARGPVVGVNVIGTSSEISDLMGVMREAFGNNTTVNGIGECPQLDYTILVVAPPPEAKVTDRHKLVFALPQKEVTQCGSIQDDVHCSIPEDDLQGHVDAPEAWKRQVNIALDSELE